MKHFYCFCIGILISQWTKNWNGLEARNFKFRCYYRDILQEIKVEKDSAALLKVVFELMIEEIIWNHIQEFWHQTGVKIPNLLIMEKLVEIYYQHCTVCLVLQSFDSVWHIEIQEYLKTKMKNTRFNLQKVRLIVVNSECFEFRLSRNIGKMEPIIVEGSIFSNLSKKSNILYSIIYVNRFNILQRTSQQRVCTHCI